MKTNDVVTELTNTSADLAGNICHEKASRRCIRPGPIQSQMNNQGRWPGTGNFGF